MEQNGTVADYETYLMLMRSAWVNFLYHFVPERNGLEQCSKPLLVDHCRQSFGLIGGYTTQYWGPSESIMEHSKNKDAPPALTLRRFTFFSAAFATFPGFCDLSVLTWPTCWMLCELCAWLLNRFDDFTMVEMFVWVPMYQTKPFVVMFFTCKALPTCQVVSTSHPWPHGTSRQKLQI